MSDLSLHKQVLPHTAKQADTGGQLPPSPHLSFVWVTKTPVLDFW